MYQLFTMHAVLTSGIFLFALVLTLIQGLMYERFKWRQLGGQCTTAQGLASAAFRVLSRSCARNSKYTGL